MPSPFLARNRACITLFRLALAFIRLSLIATLTFSSAAFGAEASLTLEQATRLAVARSRQLAAHDYEATSSREMAISAGQRPDPVLQLGIDNLPLNGTDRFSLTQDFMTMRKAGILQELTGADKLRLRANRFELAAQKSLAEKEVSKAAIERATALAWFERYYAQAMAKVSTEQGALAKLEVQAAEGAYRGGQGKQVDLLMARSALAAFDDRASELERRLRNATLMLARWIGAAANQPLGVKPPTNSISFDAATLATKLAHHPQIAVLDKQAAMAQTEVQLAEANQHSDWSVEVALQQRGRAYSNMLSLNVSTPLQWDRKHRQQPELSSKLALVEQLKAEREEVLRQHLAETQAMLNEWDNNRHRAARYQSVHLPLAQQRTAAVLVAYRGGKASLADVLAARRNDIDVRSEALQLDAETDRLWAQLYFLFPQLNEHAQPALELDGTPHEQ